MENRELIKNAEKYINHLGDNSVTLEEVAKNAGFSIGLTSKKVEAKITTAKITALRI